MPPARVGLWGTLVVNHISERVLKKKMNLPISLDYAATARECRALHAG
jgi:hypothetical protein